MKNYTITLEVLTPVYIGNGSTITKKDFAIERNYANIYAPLKLHAIMGKKYEEFLMGTDNLTNYIKFNRITNIQEALKYSVFCGNTGVRNSDGIAEFIKDPYGCPYIPGSSLKGAIRTAILSTVIKKNKSNKFSKFASTPIDDRRTRDIEEEAFGEIKDSKFKYMRIGDSAPLSTDGLILCKKIDIFQDGNSNNKLNLCREALKPGTKITFSLTIDEAFNNNQKQEVWNKEHIMNAIKSFVNQYREVYLRKFESYESEKYGDDIIYLGGGTGFITKTINYSLYDARALEKISGYLDKKFRRHNHRKDMSLGVSPRAMKCTNVNGNIVEMGICRIRID